jgi:AraC-like DNA-binding protein
MLNTYDFQIEHPNVFAQLSVNDLLFLLYRCPQEEKKVMLYTHHNKIFFVLDGKKMIHHRDKSWMMNGGQAFLLKKTPYQQERFTEAEWEVLCFYIPDSYLKKFFHEFWEQLPLKSSSKTPPSDILSEINITEATRAFFYSMIPFFTQQPAPSTALLELKFKELLFHIFSNPLNKELLASLKSMSETDKPLLSEIMEVNYTFNLSLAEYAKLTHRSLASFKRAFREIYQTTPGKWLIQKRLAYAEYLLQNSQKTIIEITLECGFENPTHFSRVFRESYGTSPLQYRKKSPAPLAV